jgi:hypothetical protein
MLMKETQALDAGLRELLVAPGDGDDASVPPEVQAALDKVREQFVAVVLCWL